MPMRKKNEYACCQIIGKKNTKVETSQLFWSLFSANIWQGKHFGAQLTYNCAFNLEMPITKWWEIAKQVLAQSCS